MPGRVFSKEFKEQAVLLTETSGKKVSEIANDLGIRENVLWRWKKEFREAGTRSFPGQGHRQQGTDLEEENRRLKQELLDVKMERDILKKAGGHFLETTPEVKYGAIHETAKENNYSIEKMCQFLEVSRSGYYQWNQRDVSATKKKDNALKEEILSIYIKHQKRYGSPRIHDELRDKGIRCSKKRVERLMGELKIRARYKRQFRKTTNSKHNYPIAPNLLNRQFEVDAPNRVWVADITYIRTFEGWLYLAAVIDLFSRKVVGWSMSKNINSDLAINALKMAIKQRRPPKGLMHHSDRGVQYASTSYQKVLKKNRIICSMSRKGNCWDNAPAESFFSTLKTECVNDKIYLSRTQAKREIFEYIEVYYNRKRRHSSIGGFAPEKFENRRKTA
ncbi:MAG TPA: IS3 family transposase [Bacteroidales bacterium]|nr:IS3 family transposase [Bacteroidales bacterium]